MLTQMLIFLLMIDAGWVFLGLTRKKNMWAWICLYWALLTAKNAADLFGWP